ncbi:hypothetical protein GCM10007972_26740 [Iodidimonas muriae]|uniref:DUF2384 domain-containing protein n=1 Tax=Iodidimonas muriae TaxID=261467 RepID=A0ABQ2LGF6_9PROT|nr:MbcA/ParS/Xre antitoxin family protein [Iodidimonas muriae]GGO17018.1 hypothetical protein GCM10007972_26740 [Iodidimonas muriae]
MPHAHSLLAPSHEAVLSKALFAAVRRLGISRTAMQKIMGMSDSTLRRIEKGSASLTANPKAYELGVLLIRLYRSLDAIAGGEESTVKSWMQSENTVLGGTPAALIQTVGGLVHVTDYLDARRALV